MPKKPLLPCRRPGCPNLSEERYCSAHRTMPKRTEAAREADKEYNRRKRDKKSQGFYESDAWRNLRKQQLNRQPLCEMCLKEGRYVKATAVDHITEIRKGGARLDIENLQSLCWSCHSRKTRSEREGSLNRSPSNNFESFTP